LLNGEPLTANGLSLDPWIGSCNVAGNGVEMR
jgi:hypothetical protein